MRIVGIIPARYHSTRLEAKALADIEGHPMIWWVYGRASMAKALTEVVVATDDSRILDAMLARGGRCVMTRPDHASGTDRVAEAAQGLGLDPGDVVINVQGDEPLLKPAAIDLLARSLAEDPAVDMATLVHRLKDPDELSNPNVVKVVVDRKGWALYFSRSPIPYQRREASVLYRHVGIYGYRVGFLYRLVQEPPTPLEHAESLEQLRVLEMGYRIKVVETDTVSTGVDTADDLDAVRRRVREEGLTPNGRKL